MADEIQQHWQATGQALLPTANTTTQLPVKTSSVELFPSTPASLQQSIIPQTVSEHGPNLQAFSQASIARQDEQVSCNFPHFEIQKGPNLTWYTSAEAAFCRSSAAVKLLLWSVKSSKQQPL